MRAHTHLIAEHCAAESRVCKVLLQLAPLLRGTGRWIKCVCVCVCVYIYIYIRVKEKPAVGRERVSEEKAAVQEVCEREKVAVRRIYKKEKEIERWRSVE